MNKIGDTIRKWRKRHSLTLREVSKEMGFNNYQTLSSIETGKREIKCSELQKLCNAYCVDSDYFLTDKEERRIKIRWHKSKHD